MVILIREQKGALTIERPGVVIKSFPSKIDVLKFTTTTNEKFDFLSFAEMIKLQSCRLIYADTLKLVDFQRGSIVRTTHQFAPAIRQKIFGYLRLYQLCLEQNLNFNKIRLNYEHIMTFIKECERPTRQSEPAKSLS